MQQVQINKKIYEVIENNQDCLDVELLNEKVTEYFDDFDYIFGDYFGDAVRLKGFNDSNNKKVKKINDIKFLEEYKKDYCGYGAKTFLLKKID